MVFVGTTSAATSDYSGSKWLSRNSFEIQGQKLVKKQSLRIVDRSGSNPKNFDIFMLESFSWPTAPGACPGSNGEAIFAVERVDGGLLWDPGQLTDPNYTTTFDPLDLLNGCYRYASGSDYIAQKISGTRPAPGADESKNDYTDSDFRTIVEQCKDDLDDTSITKMKALSQKRMDTVFDIYAGDYGDEYDNCASVAKVLDDPKLLDGDIESILIKRPSAQIKDDGVTCSAGALGWVLCPLSEAMVAAIEGIADLLENLLVYQPLLTSDQGKAIRAIWQMLLVIANVGLVFAILIIVFSQATSIGLSNYGIKKLLPRVFAAAILMNLSFYLCAAAVDVSNILGVSVKSIIDVGLDRVSGISAANPDLQAGASVGQWIAVSAAALLAGAIALATGAIFLLIPILISALMAVFTALLIIAARQVLITLLIIIAPLAILAWILPNTEDWFTKWRKLFTALLLLFPLVMAVFYGSVLVSAVILAAGSSTGNGLNDFTIKLLAFLVLVVPLFSLPFLMKSAGGILDRFGVLVNNRNKGLTDRSRKKATELRDSSTYQRGRVLRKRAADEFKGTKFANRVGRGGLSGVVARGVGGNVGKVPVMQNTRYGAQAGRLGDYAIQAEREAASKRREAIRSRFVNEGAGVSDVSAAYQRAISSGDVDTAAAAFKHLSTTFGGGGRTEAAKVLQNTDLSNISDITKRNKMSTEMDELIGGELYGSLVGSRVDIAKGGFRGGNRFGFTRVDKLTAPQLATQDGDVYSQASARGEAVNADEAYLAMTNPELISKITDSDTRQHLSSASGVPVRPPAPPPTSPAGTP